MSTQPGIHFVWAGGIQPDGSAAALDEARRMWESKLDFAASPRRPVEIQIQFTDMGANGLVGICIPTAGQQNTAGNWLPSALSETPPKGKIDMYIFFNLRVKWNYDTSKNPSLSEYDFVSVALHEMCHGFGFVTLHTVDTAKTPNEGAYGNTKAIVGQLSSKGIPPHITDQFPDFGNKDSVFGSLVCAQGKPLDLAFAAQNPSAGLAVALVSPLTLLIYPLYTPPKFEFATSVCHFGGPYENDTTCLMRPSIGLGQVTRIPDVATLSVLGAIGWSLKISS